MIRDYQLKNGATVKAEIRVGEDHYVLAFYNGQYVTWKIDSENNAYHGHYFSGESCDDLKNALRDLYKRAGGFIRAEDVA